MAAAVAGQRRGHELPAIPRRDGGCGIGVVWPAGDSVPGERPLPGDVAVGGDRRVGFELDLCTITANHRYGGDGRKERGEVAVRDWIERSFDPARGAGGVEIINGLNSAAP